MRGTLPTSREPLHARTGFTLIEVLASLVLVAIVVPVAMRGVSLAVEVAASAKHQREATTLAATKLSELIATRSWQEGNAAGDFGADAPGYSWDMVVSDWQDPLLRAVEVRVHWKAKGTERSVTLTTLARSGSQ